MDPAHRKTWDVKQNIGNYGTCNDDPPPSYTSRPASHAGMGEQTPLFSTSHTSRAEPGERTSLFPATVGLVLLVIYLLGHTYELSGPMEPAYERSIAIVGAGPAGVSAAYHLSQQAGSAGIPCRITIYDQSPHIGGRAVHTVEVFGPGSGESIELGATTFPKSASILSSAANHLGLRTTVSDDGTADLIGKGTGSFGVYDGRSWAYYEPNPHGFFGRGWWSFKLWYFYGLSGRRAEGLVRDARDKRRQLYSPTMLPFTSMVDIIENSGLVQHVSSTGEDYLSSHEISRNFQREIFNPWIRGRYAQNLGTINALAAFMAADNSPSLTINDKDGMSGLWERMVAASGATVHLTTHVFGLRKGDWGWVLASSSPSGIESITPFDAVILATPWSLTNLEILGRTLENPPQNVTYASQYTTLFTSPAAISDHAFSGNKHIPGLVLTTPCSWEYTDTSRKTGYDGLGHAPFWVLSSIKRVMHDGHREFLYKVVSALPLDDGEIERMVGGGPVSWVYRHYSPAAHPILQPRTTFSDIVLDESLWYTGVMDELVTGVEMGSLMGANIAALVTAAWKAEGPNPSPERRIPVERPEAENMTSVVVLA